MSNNNVRKVNRSIVPNGTVRGLEIFQDTTDDKLYYKDGNGNVTPLGSSTVSPENTWEIPTVAFVNPTTGDDLTAVIGDGNKPYATIAAAQAASSTVFLQPGNYIETFALVTGKTYFSYPGVLFTAGGIVNLGTTLVGTKFLGFASFISSSDCIKLESVVLTDVVLEFDRLEVTGSAYTLRIITTAKSNVVINGNSIYDPISYNAAAIVLRGPLNGSLNIKESITAALGVLGFGSAAEQVQDFTVNCPKITQMDTYGAAYPQYSQVIIASGIEEGYKVTINGDLYSDAIGTPGVNNGVVASIYSASLGVLEINGNIYAGTQRAILLSTACNIIMNGSIETTHQAFNTATGELLIKNSTIIQGVANSITGSPKVWIYGSTIKSTTTANIIDHTSATSTLVIRDTDAVGDTGEFVNTGGAARAVGMTNVVSNLANDAAMTSLYTALGFTQDAALVTPDFT